MTASSLISTEALAARLDDPKLRILDASWHLDGSDPRAGFVAAHIPGAAFFDLEAISDQDSPLPHMLPSPASFAASMGVLGVSEDSPVVVYDTLGLVTAARAWWMLRIMGAREVHVLDGGLPKWRAEGRPLATGPAPSPGFAVFSPRLDARAVADMADVREALSDGIQVIDARSAARFRGEAPEPRPGLRSGHMPGAFSVPSASVLGPDGTMKRGAALEAVFRAAGVDPERPVVTTCGSGVTAAILTLALAELGRPSRLYDGSWTEWGAPEGGPVVAGPR